MKIILAFVLTGMCGISLQAQQTVASSGKEASGTGGSASNSKKSEQKESSYNI